MKHATKPLAALAVSIALVVGTAGAARADIASGDRYCPAGRTLTTGSTSTSGLIAHTHTNISTGAVSYKSWTNTTTTTRYWNAAYRNVHFLIQTQVSGALLSYTTACYA